MLAFMPAVFLEISTCCRANPFLSLRSIRSINTVRCKKSRSIFSFFRFYVDRHHLNFNNDAVVTKFISKYIISLNIEVIKDHRTR